MIDIEEYNEVNECIDIEKFVRSLYYIPEPYESESFYRCPFCKEKGLNFSYDEVFCSECGLNVNATMFFMMLRLESFEDSVEYVKKYFEEEHKAKYEKKKSSETHVFSDDGRTEIIIRRIED